MLFLPARTLRPARPIAASAWPQVPGNPCQAEGFDHDDVEANGQGCADQYTDEADNKILRHEITQDSELACAQSTPGTDLFGPAVDAETGQANDAVQAYAAAD